MMIETPNFGVMAIFFNISTISCNIGKFSKKFRFFFTASGIFGSQCISNIGCFAVISGVDTQHILNSKNLNVFVKFK